MRLNSYYYSNIHRHCLSGFQGFQQQMQPPQMPYQPYQPRQPPAQPGYGSKCFSCPPTPMRYKRSLNDAPIVEAEENDEVNASLPIYIKISAHDLTQRQQLLKLMPAINPLKNGNVKYRISKGNDDRMLRMHTKGEIHFVHLSHEFTRKKVDGRRITLEAIPHVDEAVANRASLNNDVMKKAMQSILQFDVEFTVEDTETETK